MSVLNKLKSSLVQTYLQLKYPEARRMKKKGIPFDHFRELNRSWLRTLGIKTVLDIGANKGQFAKLAREVFAEARIYSFEPLPDCFRELQNALSGDKKFFPFNKAIGRSESILEFFRSIHSPSSSFLEMEELHKEAFPESIGGQVQQAIEVKVDTLDGFYTSEKPELPVLLKIDVQGFEGEVIAGATNMLKNVKVVILEMSVRKLYKDQPLFHDIYMAMHNHGFGYHGNLSQMIHPVTGEVVQLDAIFIQED